MTEDRRTLGSFRQLSLQQTTSSRQKIVRHRSADDEKSLQVYGNTTVRGKLIGNGKTLVNRPKVRIAWSENHRKNEKQVEKVEVVAHQIPGKLRANAGRYRSFSGSEKASILFSRQQLAERLRLAWKHREENKSNIDIVLAHNVHEERCDSTLSSQSTFTAPPTPRGEKTTSSMCNGSFPVDVADENDEKGEDKSLSKPVECSLNGEVLQESDETQNANRNGAEVRQDSSSVNQKKRTVQSNDSVNTDAQSGISSSLVADATVHQMPKDDLSSAKQKRASFRSGTNKAFLTIAKSTDEKQKTPTENTSQSILPSSVSNNKSSSKIILKNDGNVSMEKCEIPKNTKEAQSDFVSQRKYYYDDQSERLLKFIAPKSHQKSDMKFRDVSTVDNASLETATNLINTSSKIPRENKDNSQTDRVRMMKVSQSQKPNQNGKSVIPRRNLMTQNVDPRTRRTNSAPPMRNFGGASSSNRIQVNIVIDTPGATKSTEKSIINCQNSIECRESDSRIERFDSALSKVSYNRPTRSAPLKRRSKSTKRRLFSGLSKADDETNRAGTRRSGVDGKTIDVVTMVSLVSSADSDSDIENSPGDDNLINELRSKLPTTPIIKASINAVAPRRPIKSVSFQNDSFDEDAATEVQVPAKEEKRSNHARFGITQSREKADVPVSCNDSLPKQETTGVVLPLLQLAHDTGQLSDVQLTDREKRCLAVPIGDLHDNKRKLLKTRSTPCRPSVLERQAVSIETKEQHLLNNVPRIRPLMALTPLLPDKATLDSFSPQLEQALITSEKSSEEIQLVMCEPHFQTPKEKECWQLYRKMCDKGVCVSFDTVLRGMLTPTEYRLRQKEMQNS